MNVEHNVAACFDEWTIDFKSNRIASKAMRLMQSYVHLEDLYNRLHKDSILRGRLFERLFGVELVLYLVINAQGLSIPACTDKKSERVIS